MTRNRYHSFPASALLLFLLLLPGLSHGSFEERGNSATALGSGSTLASDPWTPSGRAFNPASAAWVNQFAFSASYARPFDLKELDQVRFDLVYPFGSRVAGIGISSFGGELYSERSLTASLSQRLTPWFSLGIAAGQVEVNIDRYGSDRAWIGDAGLLLNLRFLQVGVGGINLFSTRMSRYGSDPVPKQSVVSLRIAPDERLVFMLETQMEEVYRPGYRFGGQFQLYPNLVLRSGYDTASERMHLGLGLIFQGMSIDGSYDNHPWLGWTKAFGLGWGIRTHE